MYFRYKNFNRNTLRGGLAFGTTALEPLSPARATVNITDKPEILLHPHLDSSVSSLMPEFRNAP